MCTIIDGPKDIKHFSRLGCKTFTKLTSNIRKISCHRSLTNALRKVMTTRAKACLNCLFIHLLSLLFSIVCLRISEDVGTFIMHSFLFS